MPLTENIIKGRTLFDTSYNMRFSTGNPKNLRQDPAFNVAANGWQRPGRKESLHANEAIKMMTERMR